MSDAALPQLLQAKAHSDQKKYHQKHRVLALMMKRNPKAFIIDSDDGKGIVGVTHVDTGFRLHMPVGAIPVPLEKAAANPFKAIASAYNATKNYTKDPLGKTVELLQNKPRLEQAFRKVTEYRLLDPRNKWRNMRGGAYLTSPLGALTGAFTGDTKEEKLRNSALGAVAGAGVGAAAGRYLPRAGQWSLGRVLTNVMEPLMYGDDKHAQDLAETLKTHGVKGIARAIAKDQPLNEVSPARSALFRDFFGMKRWDSSKNVFNQAGKLDDGTKLLTHNMRDLGGRQDLREIHKARASGATFGLDSGRWMRRGQTHNPAGGSLGGFTVTPQGKFTDTWDFALHPHERIDSKTNLLRAMVSPFGTPPTVVGRTLNESQALRFSRPNAKSFNNIHPSFTQPVLDRAVRGAGLDVNETTNYIRQRLARGGHSPVMKSIASRAAGKPYNLLQDLAKAEGVSNSDMRVLLGGTPRKVHTISKKPKWAPGDLVSMFSKRIPGANPTEVSNAIEQLSPVQEAALRKGLTKWTAAGRPQGGEIGILARVLGFAPDELPVLLG